MSLTSTITNTVKDLNGTPIVGVSVDILLKPSGAFRIDDSTEIAPKETVVTDVNGTWSVNLERTSNISPANSHYLVTEKIPVANGGPSTWAIQVGAANQTLLAALIIPAPSSSSSLFLTQATGDARYLQIADANALHSSVVDTSISNTAVDTPVATLAIPGNTLQTGDVLEFDVLLDTLNNTGIGINFTFMLKFGATTVLTTANVNHAASALRQSMWLTGKLYCRSTTSQCIVAQMSRVSSAAVVTWRDIQENSGLQVMDIGTAAEDTTVTLSLVLSVIMNTADPLIETRVRAYSSKILRAA